MGKNKRKRKLKEQDFKKVKLKVGKRLQAAQNAVDTSFKSRTIFVPTQLSEDYGPTNQRKQSLKDLLTQVGHYSATMRQEAFVGLRDLFKRHPDLLHENLGVIIKALAEKMTDNDASVRQSLLLLLSYIFPSISQENMAPFCPLILAHLSCAMTHIYDDIQHDSLGFLELCLQCFPECMVISSSQLIQNFIGMISHRSRAGNAKKRHLDQLGGKGLCINPNGKLSSSKSRLKVLQHLLAFLKALESSVSFNKGTSQYLFNSVSKRLKRKPPVVKFLQQEPTKAQILEHSIQESAVLSFTLDGGSPLVCPNNNDNKSNILSDSQQIRELMETVFPLLLECWIECNPAQLTTGLPDSVMFSSTINPMLTITEILKVLFKAAQRTGTNHLSCFDDHSRAKWLSDLYLKDFNQQFMVYFPFVANCSGTLKKIKGKLGKSSWRSMEGKDAASVLALNFGICEIMMDFLTKDNSGRKSCHISVGKLKEFVVHSLEMKANGGVKSKLLQAEHIERLVQFVNQLVFFYCTGKQDSEMVKELLDATYKLYQASRHMSGSKNTLLQFFASLVFSENHLISRHKDVCMLASEWIPSLPNLLVKLKDTSFEMTEVVLIVLTKAVMQRVLKPDADFLSYLSMFFSENTGSFVKMTESLQRRAIELLFQLPSLSDQFVHCLVECCQTAHVQGSVIEYLLQILHYRSPCYQGVLSESAAFSLATYLSFLLSVAIGCSKKQLNKYQLQTNLGLQFHKYTLPGQYHFVILEQNEQGEGENRPDDPQFVLWQGHQATLQAACQNYKQCNQSHDLLRPMGVALSTFLVDFKVLPVSVVYSVLTVVNCLVELASAGRTDHSPSTSRHLSNELLSKLAELSVVCLSWSTDTNSSTFSRHAHTEEPLTCGTMTMKLDLFHTAVELLCKVPLMTSKVLSVLLRIVTDEDNDDVMKAIFAKVMTKLLQSAVKTVLIQSKDVVQQIVSRVLSSESRCFGQSQCYADLQYQYSLFRLLRCDNEVNLESSRGTARGLQAMDSNTTSIVRPSKFACPFAEIGR